VNAAASRKVRFIVSGGGTTVLFVLLGWMFVQAGLSPFIGTLLAYVCAFAVGYMAQQFWTFSDTGPGWASLPRYIALQLGCGVFSGVLSHATANLIGLRPFFMSLTTAIVAGIISYLVSARWVFTAPASRTR